MSQRSSASAGTAPRPSLPLESAVVAAAVGLDKFTSAILTYLWVQCYKTASHDEILSRFDRAEVPGSQGKPKGAAEPRIC